VEIAVENPDLKLFVALLVAGAIVVLGIPFGYVRAAVAVLAFAGLSTFAFRYWRDVGLYPPDPEPQDVSAQGLKYVCNICGLELRVEVASKDKAPTHCMEPMELVQVGGTAPLRPVD
jgi:hypothetical protein